MTDGLEAAGALATASLAAGAIEAAKGRDRQDGVDAEGADDTSAADHAVCLNCGATLTGRFCAACGQPTHVHHSLLHLTEEILHGLLHFDAKGWRTLPLLIAKPGVLTRRYIEGQRARYVSPLALFLFMVFLMFFVASIGNLKPTIVDNTGIARSETEKLLSGQRVAEAEADAALARAKATGTDVDDAREALEEAHRDVVMTEGSLKAMNAVSRAMSAASSATAAGGQASRAAVAAASGRDKTITQPSLRDMVVITVGDSNVDTGSARLDAAITHAAENPDLTIYKLKNTAYKFSFLLVPLSLPFLWLLFMFRRDVAMYDHAVFVLYSLSFMSLLFVVLVGLSALGLPELVGFMTLAVPPLHIGLQLRDAYRLRLFATLWRTVVLMIVSSLVLLLFVLAILYVTMA